MVPAPKIETQAEVKVIGPALLCSMGCMQVRDSRAKHFGSASPPQVSGAIQPVGIRVYRRETEKLALPSPALLILSDSNHRQLTWGTDHVLLLQKVSLKHRNGQGITEQLAELGREPKCPGSQACALITGLYCQRWDGQALRAVT